MPFNLILILAPKTIFLNENNEVIRNPRLSQAGKKSRLSIKSMGEVRSRSNSIRIENDKPPLPPAAGDKPTVNKGPEPAAAASSIKSASSEPTPELEDRPVIPQGAASLMSVFSDPGDENSIGAAQLMDLFNDPAGQPAATDTTEEASPKQSGSTTAADSAPTGSARAVSPAEDVAVAAVKNIQPERTASEKTIPTTDTADADTVVHATEVNIKEYVLKELQALHQGDYIAQSPTITADETGETFQALCVCDNASIDMVLGRLAHCGVGNIIGSVNVVSLESSMFSKAATDMLKEDLPVLGTEDSAGIEGMNALSKDDDSDAEEEQRKLFMETASQLRVEQVVEQIKEAATLTFDYLSLLIIASTIAGIGLAVNSTVSIVASMLVSPIMGPVLALTFGSVINNTKLMWLGLKTELISLFICICVGFAIGVVAIGVGTDGAWPTTEMKTRGLTYGLLVGLAIAVPSGMGVALSILGDNTSSLVGVAISASLLPPAVNCGLAFAYAAFGFQSDRGAVDDDTGDFVTSAAYVDMGGISLALTIVNIGAIFISGSIMFRLKDVTPAKHKIAFWQVEGAALKVYRKHNTAQTGIDLHNLDVGDVDVLKSVGSNKLLRKELLDIYKQSSMEDEDERANSKNTIRRNSDIRRKTAGGTAKEIVPDVESQIEPTSDQDVPPVTPPVSAIRKRATTGERSHRRHSSESSPSPLRFNGSRRQTNAYHQLPMVTSLELQDTRARMRSFGRAMPPPR